MEHPLFSFSPAFVCVCLRVPLRAFHGCRLTAFLLGGRSLVVIRGVAARRWVANITVGHAAAGKSAGTTGLEEETFES